RLQGMDLSQRHGQSQAFARAVQHPSRLGYTGPVVLVDGQRGYWLALGLRVPPGRPPLILGASYSLDRLLPRVVAGSPYAVTFVHDGSVLHAHQDPAPPARFGGSLVRTSVVNLPGGARIELQVAPTPSLLRDQMSGLPQLMFGMGLLLAGVAG